MKEIKFSHVSPVKHLHKNKVSDLFELRGGMDYYTEVESFSLLFQGPGISSDIACVEILACYQSGGSFGSRTAIETGYRDIGIVRCENPVIGTRKLVSEVGRWLSTNVFDGMSLTLPLGTEFQSMNTDGFSIFLKPNRDLDCTLTCHFRAQIPDGAKLGNRIAENTPLIGECVCQSLLFGHMPQCQFARK